MDLASYKSEKWYKTLTICITFYKLKKNQNSKTKNHRLHNIGMYLTWHMKVRLMFFHIQFLQTDKKSSFTVWCNNFSQAQQATTAIKCIDGKKPHRCVADAVQDKCCIKIKCCSDCDHYTGFQNAHLSFQAVKTD